jgi:hypothetical protein
MKKQTFFLIVVISYTLTCCNRRPENIKEAQVLPPIYPDYMDVTIPFNIAPLNFLFRGDADALEIKVKGVRDSLIVHGNKKICFPLKVWKKLLQRETGNNLTVSIMAHIHNRWICYKPFHWNVVGDKIDSYLSYRLIEPGYEIWNALQICERNVENFEERVIADNNQLNQSCMNCHIYGSQNGNLSMFHLRGKNGGTILNRNGKLRKLALKNGKMISNAVYGAFHPSGNFGVFSTNIIIPELHARGSKRMEVYDTLSDVIVTDFNENRILQSSLLSNPYVLETFPVFSADGKEIYFCSAPKMKLPDQIKDLKYSLCRISFDAFHKKFGICVDTLWNARLTGKSVCFPKVSPNGKYILFTVADYGTFPIWHRETDLQLINLNTGLIDSLTIVNSDKSDTYHSWSSNSCWFVFASKRDDGQYGKPYFAYIDKTGKAHKPFVLPQKDPVHYEQTLKSYNIPELSVSKLPFHARDIEKIYRDLTAEVYK